MSGTIQIEWVLLDAQRQKMEPVLARALHYAPPWLQSVTVRESHADDGSILSTSPMPEYRVSTIHCDKAWFAESDAEQLVAVIHEVLHAHIEGLATVFGDLLKAVEPNEDAPIRKWASEQWRRAEEATISDLSRAIAKREECVPA